MGSPRTAAARTRPTQVVHLRLGDQETTFRPQRPDGRPTFFVQELFDAEFDVGAANALAELRPIVMHVGPMVSAGGPFGNAYDTGHEFSIDPGAPPTTAAHELGHLLLGFGHCETPECQERKDLMAPGSSPGFTTITAENCAAARFRAEPLATRYREYQRDIGELNQRACCWFGERDDEGNPVVVGAPVDLCGFEQGELRPAWECRQALEQAPEPEDEPEPPFHILVCCEVDGVFDRIREEDCPEPEEDTLCDLVCCDVAGEPTEVLRGNCNTTILESTECSIIR